MSKASTLPPSLRSSVAHECATDVLVKWRDDNESEANMASLESSLREMGREDIANNFKKLAYASYAKETAVTIVKTGPEDSDNASGAVEKRRISEFLDEANGMDDMFGDIRSPALSPSPGRTMEDVFIPEDGTESPEKQAAEEETNKDKMLKEMFANNKDVLDFFASDAKADSEETEI